MDLILSTQSVSQSLYEKGFITYIRTDSTVISKIAIEGIRDTITNLVGKNYIGNPKQRKSKKKVADQEAHEAIRPTDMNKDYSNLNKEEQKLYLIIWRRTMASQMVNEEFENATLKLVPDKESWLFHCINKMANKARMDHNKTHVSKSGVQCNR